MRFNKYILITILSVTLIISLANCENDEGDDDQEYTIVGSWLLSSVVLKDTPVGNLNMTAAGFLGQSGTGAETSTLSLNEDGSAAVTTTYTAAPDTTEPGSWSQEDDLLTIDGAGIDATVPFTLESSTLTLQHTFAIDFDLDGVTEDTQVDMTYQRL